jgi:hypothetical protein
VPIAGRAVGGRHAPVGGADLRRVSPGALARPDGSRPGRIPAPADDRIPQRPLRAVLAGRALAGIHLRPSTAGRGRAGASEGSRRSGGQGSGPRAAGRWAGRGEACLGSAAWGRGVRVVAGREAPGRRVDVSRRDLRGGRSTTRQVTQAARARGTGLGLPLHRPSRLHAQRAGLPVRPGPPPLAGRRRDRSRDPS